MKLSEVTNLKVDTLVMVVNKLADTGRVHMHSTFAGGTSVKGVVRRLRLAKTARNHDYTLVYREILANGEIDSASDLTSGPVSELEAARLEKQGDIFILYLPNHESNA